MSANRYLLAAAAIFAAVGPATRAAEPLRFTEYLWSSGGTVIRLRLPATWHAVPSGDALQLLADTNDPGAGTIEIRIDRLHLTPDPALYRVNARLAFAAAYDEWREDPQAPDGEARYLATRAGKRVVGSVLAWARNGVGRRLWIHGRDESAWRLASLVAEVGVLEPLLRAELVRLPADPLTASQLTLMTDMFGKPGAAARQQMDQYLKAGELVADWLPRSQEFQDQLRATARDCLECQPAVVRERLKRVPIYCPPLESAWSTYTSAFEDGTHYIQLTYRLMQALALLSQQYTALREKGGELTAISQAMDEYLRDLAHSTNSGAPLPRPLRIDATVPAQRQRFWIAFRSAAAFVLFHEMAHEYNGHLSSHATESSLEQEAKADNTARLWLDQLVEQNSDYWAGGPVLAVALIAYHAEGGIRSQFNSHALGIQRFEAILNELGGRDLELRRDPWRGLPGALQQGGLKWFATGQRVELGSDGSRSLVTDVEPGWVHYTDEDSGQTVMRPFRQKQPRLMHRFVTPDGWKGAIPDDEAQVKEILSEACTGTSAQWQILALVPAPGTAGSEHRRWFARIGEPDGMWFTAVYLHPTKLGVHMFAAAQLAGPSVEQAVATSRRQLDAWVGSVLGTGTR